MVSRKNVFPLRAPPTGIKVYYSSYVISGRIEEKANFVVNNIICYIILYTMLT